MSNKSDFVNFSCCSILPKKGSYPRFMLGLKKGQKHRRHPVVVFGEFQTRKEFNQALLMALRDEDGNVWDLRTIRWHDGVSFCKDNTGSVIALGDFYEDAV